jgi:Bacterial PH domain/Short C-terminal domain
MPTLEEIRDQIGHLPGGKGFLGRKEVKQLPSILWEDEAIESIIRGFYANGTGILIATNKRLVFVDKGITSLRVEDFPYDKITSIQYHLGIAGGTLTIFASGNKADIQHVPKDQCKAFGDFVRARTTGVTQHQSATPPASDVPASPLVGDMLDQLERLGRLKEQGVLTEDEFQAQKAKILRS